MIHMKILLEKILEIAREKILQMMTIRCTVPMRTIHHYNAVTGVTHMTILQENVPLKMIHMMILQAIAQEIAQEMIHMMILQAIVHMRMIPEIA
jgi:hypothetical protein